MIHRCCVCEVYLVHWYGPVLLHGFSFTFCWKWGTEICYYNFANVYLSWGLLLFRVFSCPDVTPATHTHLTPNTHTWHVLLMKWCPLSTILLSTIFWSKVHLVGNKTGSLGSLFFHLHRMSFLNSHFQSVNSLWGRESLIGNKLLDILSF